MPPKRGLSDARKGMSDGIAIVARTNRVQIQGERGVTSQPTTRVRNVKGAERLRRRLSNIFQRLIAGILIPTLEPFPEPRKLKIQGRSCQSPRTQRWWRAASASYCEGNSSKSSMSEARAVRAKIPSKRS